MPMPMWQEIAEELRRRIEDGQFHDGDPLPSESELGKEFGSSRNTIRTAIGWLTTHSLVQARSGQGTFVRKIVPFVTVLSAAVGAGPGSESAAYATEVAATDREASVSDLRIEIQQAAATPVAAELRLEADAMVLSRHQQRFIDGNPWSLQTTFYPMKFVDDGAAGLLQAKDMPGGAVQYLGEKLGITEAGWRDKFTVRAPDKIETDFFQLPADGRVGVIQFVRIGYDQHGQPFRVTRTTYPADRNEFVMTGGIVPPEKKRLVGNSPATPPDG
jgi:GntR family transcriptional regulator